MGRRPSSLLYGMALAAALLASPLSAAAGSVSYVYDDLGRLTQIVYDDGWAIQISYDAAGNRTARVVAPPA